LSLPLQEPLLPTPTNITPIHIPGCDLLQYVQLQQSVAALLNIKLPFLKGMFVLVPSDNLQQQQRQQQQYCGDVSSSGVAAAIPWRLRQVSSVEVAPGVDPADATVVLVGGDRVGAGAVYQGLLQNVQDYQVNWLVAR
jgi:hypothetical protein